jgi:hypothetical protein
MPLIHSGAWGISAKRSQTQVVSVHRGCATGVGSYPCAVALNVPAQAVQEIPSFGQARFVTRFPAQEGVIAWLASNRNPTHQARQVYHQAGAGIVSGVLAVSGTVEMVCPP